MTALSPMDSMVTTSYALYCIIKYQFSSNPDPDMTAPSLMDSMVKTSYALYYINKFCMSCCHVSCNAPALK